jgi:hypothetical protein
VVEADQRTRLTEPRIRDFEVLVVGGYLWLQHIQLCVTEDLPPLATLRCVGGLGHLPVGVLLVRAGSCFLVFGCERRGRLHILRPDHATAQQKRSETGESCGT